LTKNSVNCLFFLLYKCHNKKTTTFHYSAKVSRLSTIRQKFKTLSYLAFVLCSMNRPLGTLLRVNLNVDSWRKMSKTIANTKHVRVQTGGRGGGGEGRVTTNYATQSASCCCEGEKINKIFFLFCTLVHFRLHSLATCPFHSKVQLTIGTCAQGCQMVCFQTKKPNLGKFWRVLQWKMMVYFMGTWSVLRSFVIFYGHLV
jgi:hypothetical protein